MSKWKERLWENKELIVAFFLVLMLLITGSYAWYQYNLSSDKVHMIKMGNLKLVLNDSMSDGILISNAVPISDEKGLSGKAYTFSLENFSTATASYTIYLDDLALDENETRMKDENIKYSFIKNDGAAKTDILSTIGENPNRILETGTIPGKSKNNYSLRVWIDQNAGNDVMGTVFYGKIRIVTESHPDTNPPSDQTKNKNIEKAMVYNSTSCAIGEEETCIETSCLDDNTAGSCPAGTIIKYKVNDTEEKYFYVLHDNGKTLTLQQRKNTVYNVKYSESGNTSNGPTAALTQIEAETMNWTNVNMLSYTMGETVFLTNAYTACDASLACIRNSYVMAERKARARIVTVQELLALGCNGKANSCPTYMFDYLTNTAHNDSHTENGATRNAGYWTMSAKEEWVYDAWRVDTSGNIGTAQSGFNEYGARAVVEINK